jgi:hypothetical protein
VLLAPVDAPVGAVNLGDALLSKQKDFNSLS